MKSYSVVIPAIAWESNNRDVCSVVAAELNSFGFQVAHLDPGRASVVHLDTVFPGHRQFLTTGWAESHTCQSLRAVEVIRRCMTVVPGEDALLVVQCPNLDFSITSGRDEVLWQSSGVTNNEFLVVLKSIGWVLIDFGLVRLKLYWCSRRRFIF